MPRAPGPPGGGGGSPPDPDHGDDGYGSDGESNRTPSVTSSAARRADVKSYDPFRTKAPTFKGDISKSFEFITRCRTLFLADPKYRGRDRHSQRRCIHALGNQLEGEAFRWFANQATKTGYWADVWDDFYSAFLLRFGDVSRRSDAIHKIYNCRTELKMKPGESVQTHIGRFEDTIMIADLDYIPSADKISLLYSTLDPNLRNLIRTAQYSDYDTFVNHVILTAEEEARITAQRRAASASTSGQRFFPFNRARRPPGAPTAGQGQQSQSSSSSGFTNQSFNRAIGQAPARRRPPMDLAPRGSLAHRKPDMSNVPSNCQGDLSDKAVVAALEADNRCYCCRQQGHIRYYCPYEPLRSATNSSGFSIRAVMAPYYQNQDVPIPEMEELWPEEEGYDPGHDQPIDQPVEESLYGDMVDPSFL